MPREGLSRTTSDIRKPVHRRVARYACDNCRVKRLKCTYNERPCLNCKLYQKDCTQTGGPKSKKAAKRVANLQACSTRQETIEDPYLISDAPRCNESQDPGGSPVLRSPAHLLPDYELAGPGSFENDFPRPDAQLDDLFQYNLWRVDGPINDLPFLGDLVNRSASFQEQPEPPDPGHSFDLTECQEQDLPQVPFSMPTPISPHGQHGDRVSGLESLAHGSGPAVFETHIPPGLFIDIGVIKSGFLGSNSAGATLAACIHHSMRRYPALTSDLNFEWLVQAGKHISRLDTAETIELSSGQLPPKSLATRWIASYMHNVHIHYPIIRTEIFQTIWEALYDPTRTSHRASNYLLFCLVLTIGAASERKDTPSTPSLDEFSRNLFQKACTLMYTPLTESSPAALQVLLLLIIFLQLNGQYSMASVLCGLSIRLCQALGLHRHVPADLEIDQEEIRYRSQLWWIAFHLEISVAMSEGRPTAVHELTYDVEVLPLCHSSRLTPDTLSTASEAHKWTAKLTELCNKLCTLNSLCISTDARLDALADLDESLRDWKDSLPSERRPGSEMIGDGDHFVLIAPLHLEYFNLMRAIHWAHITSLTTTSGGDENRRRHLLRTSEMRCLSAARSFVQTLNSITDGGTDGSPFPVVLHTDHNLAVLATLYRAICADPQRMAAKSDLEHLRAVKLHLERDSFSRGWSFTLQVTMDSMLDIANKLVCGCVS